MMTFSVRAVDHDAGNRIDHGLDMQSRLNIAAHAMLAGKHRSQVVILVKDINRGAQIRVHARRVGHQTKALPFQDIRNQMKVVNTGFDHDSSLLRCP